MTQLTSLLAVVRGGSITAAADELVVTQPSVSAALSALAREVGAELLERSGRGVRLSPAGAAFAPYAADVVGLLDQGRQAVREAVSDSARRLRIAAVTTAAESFVPPLMQAFGAAYPGVALALDVGNRERVLSAVLEHRVDVAITGRPPSDERIAAVTLRANEIVLVTAAGDPLARRARVSRQDLEGRTWLLREEGSGTRALNEQFLSALHEAPQTLTLGSNGAIKQAARVGLGVSLLSRDAVGAELVSGALTTLAVEGLPTPRPWYAVRSTVGPMRRPVADFLAFLAAELPTDA
ncbi:MAG: LysR family transcriptional regulator [Actinomycetota bacterium]|nr:LysR family transcriptional regulator [Actinomycetota bacterium]